MSCSSCCSNRKCHRSKRCRKRLKKLAKKTHVAGANCCSSFKNALSHCHHH